MWNDSWQQAGQRSSSFKLIIRRGLVGVRSHEQTPIDQPAENLPSVNGSPSHQPPPISDPPLQIVSHAVLRPPLVAALAWRQ